MHEVNLCNASSQPLAATPFAMRTRPAPVLRALLAALLLCAPVLQAQTPSSGPGAVEAGVDAGVKPGDDFFAYANGAWLKATEIPAGKSRWSTRDEIGDLTRQQMQKVMDDTAAAPAGSTARKIGDFRAAYLDEARIEAKGIAPLKPMLDRIESIRDKAALTRYLGGAMQADVDPMNAGTFRSANVLGFAVESSIHGEKTNVAFLVQGGLGLPDREPYLGADPAMQAARARYQDAVGKVLALLAAPKTQGKAPAAPAALSASTTAAIAKRAEAVMALETAIARSHVTAEASGEERNADNVWTRADFAREAPGMDWGAFFTAAGLGSERAFVAWQPSAVVGVAALVASQPLQVWKDYLRVRAVDAYADVLPRAFAEQAPALRGVAAGQQASPRAVRATEATQAAFSEAIGRLYVERNFPAPHKARVEAIKADVVAAFAKRVEAASWMSPASKTMALAKLKAMYFGVGYPETWQDYSDLAIHPADAAGNVRRIAERKRRQMLAKLGKPIDNTEWAVAPQWPGALLMFQQNSYNFSAALLQAPKFDPAAPEAMNYGAIGAIVGHEVSHLVDKLGAEYEADGRARRWWTPEDIAQFEAAYAPLVAQFSSYRPFPDAAVDGKLTLTENIADLGGLAAAFDAHRARVMASEKGKAGDKHYIKQQDRLFFIGFARSWRGKFREDALRKYLKADGHAPETYRIATVRNLDAWYEAFDVQPGDKLYLAPAARVRIW